LKGFIFAIMSKLILVIHILVKDIFILIENAHFNIRESLNQYLLIIGFIGKKNLQTHSKSLM
tara:strand:- start:4340 stop:4525 length:186 start_codon:yes stop_codon:yes gene_type:complete